MMGTLYRIEMSLCILLEIIKYTFVLHSYFGDL